MTCSCYLPRRIKAIKHLSVSDVAEDRAFPDVIGYGVYGWDINVAAGETSARELRKPERTPIPYGVMVPETVTNLICPGRAVDVERQVLGILRVQCPCMAMGEAAGTAAAQVVADASSFATVDIDALRAELRRNGAIVDPTA